ncbi:hypothetical protein [Chryseobacterium populi]|uniref:Uncharacterized protein n=1 Tax=Chryseobacterium populi TaxID=1144316 RepID=J2K2M7_9FLAO|nr:hypothetical protein [Chryseobacterium populi]EJL74410.1 hypothetical protein PMI13_01149 [Chryseobacterium populi]
MQIRTGQWAMLLLFLIFFQYCSKSDHAVVSEPVQKSSIISLAKAKEWTLGNINSVTTARSNTTGFIGTPSWSRIDQIYVPGGQGILKIALEKYRIPFGYRDLLFQQQDDGIVRSIVQQVCADSAYLSGKILAEPFSGHGIRHYIQNADFTGDIIYFDPLDNHFLYGWRYKEGKPKFRLKQAASALARSGGGPIDNDDTGDDDGGSSDPGWTGTGNNTDGYTIDGPEITAPAPPTHNPPPYIPPTTDPGPVNPPTIPVGGSGNQAGGNGGPKEDPKEGESYEDSDVQPGAIPCPTSYNYIKQGNWQTAVIIDYYFQFFESSTGVMYDIQIGTMETGMPAITYNGSLIQASQAQAMSTQAARLAEWQVATVINAYVLLNPGTTPAQIRNNPTYAAMFKSVYAEELNKFLRADYDYRPDSHPVTVSTSQMNFVNKNMAQWIKLKFVGRDC